MRTLILPLATIAVLLLASPSLARAKDTPEPRPGDREARKARILERFDLDKDGKLNDEEKA